MLEAMGNFNDELRDAGILRAADGLKPSSQGKRVAFDGPAVRSSMGLSRRPKSWSQASGCRDGSRKPPPCTRGLVSIAAQLSRGVSEIVNEVIDVSREVVTENVQKAGDGFIRTGRR